MRIYEELTGITFPYNKYDQTIVANFNFGGMENIAATTFSDNEIFFGDFNKNIVENIVSHELSHSWFGDLVTCRNWAELWLNEGFATFMEAAYRGSDSNRTETNDVNKIYFHRRLFSGFLNSRNSFLFNPSSTLK
jgi:aminopeptidase N